MRKVKVFYAINGRVGGIKSLEDAINEFFGERHIKVHNILQDASGRLDHHVTVTIFYEV